MLSYFTWKQYHSTKISWNLIKKISFYWVTLYRHQFHGGNPHSIGTDMLHCIIIVSDFEPETCYYVLFRTKNLGKSINPLTSELLVKLYYWCSYTRTDLALNNPRKLMCHKTEKLKQTEWNLQGELLTCCSVTS